MSILETFYILFKGDSSDVKRAAEDSKRSVQSLQDALLGLYPVAEESTKKIGHSFLELTKAAAGFLGVATAAYALFHGVSAATSYAVELGKVSRELGINAGELDAWSNAVQRSGGSAQGFQQSLRSLSQHLGGSAQIALKVLPQLADTLQRLGKTQALNYGKQLGLDESTILLLQQGRREVEAQIAKQRELGVVTQKDTEIAIKFNQAVNDTGHAMRGLFTALSLSVLPVLTKIFNAITPIVEYLREHKNLVVGALLAIGAAAVVMAAPFVVANAVVLATAAGIAALIAAFAIAYEDITAFLAGEESLTGDMLKKWPEIGRIVQGVISVFKDLYHVLESIGGLFNKIGDGFEKLAYSFKSDANKKVSLDIAKGKTLFGQADGSGLNSRSSNSIFGGSSQSKNNTVNTGPISIQTQATDGEGVASAFGKGLQEHLWQANSNFDDGVLA